MINICRSNRLIHLGNEIAERLRSEREGDPFISDNIIVPNLDTSNWLKLHIAEQNGFSGNTRFMLPAEWMWHSIRELKPELPKELPSDPEPMKWTLFSLLSDPGVRNHFPLLHKFVNRQPNENREEAMLQLAGRLASLYDKYLVYRPAMILRWQNGHTGKGDERWQAELWNMMNARWKGIHSDEKSLNRAELYELLRKQSSGGATRNQSPIFIFNPGLMPLPVAQVLREQGTHRNITLFLISPSPTSDAHPLLEMFGDESAAAGKLYRIDKAETKDLFKPDFSQDSSNAARIRNSLLTAESGISLHTNDGSIPGIEIHSCHSPLREIEVLHDALLRLLESDEHLQPDEILVVTPDLEKYLPHIHAVFGNPEPGLPAIPYHAGSSGGSSLMDRALLHLLSMPGSRFGFNDVMDFFLMDPVLDKFGLTESSASLVREWMKENHVYWGFNAEHRMEWNQPGSDVQTWKAALRRGWLGQMMATAPGEFARNTLLFPAITTSEERESWAAFSAFMEKLHQTAQEAKGQKSAAEWCDLVDLWCDRFFSPRSLMDYKRAGGSGTDRIRESAKLSGLDHNIPFQLIRSDIEEQMNRKTSGRARLHRGVTFSNMVPVRSLPFKAIALIGLNEGAFPRKENTPEYDLMGQQPEPTDRNHRNEDKNLFLESLLAAETYHYCSYIGQSAVDNEPIPPSPILSGWVSFLSELTGLDEDQIIQKESLSLFSLNNYKNRKSYSKLGFLSATAVNAAWERFAFDGLEPDDEPVLPLLVTAQEFCSFFANPVKAFARNRLEARLTGEEEERDEFTISGLEKHLLYQRVFAWFTEEQRREQDIRGLLLNSGILPAGWPGERLAHEIVSSVQESIALIRSLGFTPGLHRYNTDLNIDGLQLTGEITSYSNERYLDLSFSTGSGSLYLQSWIRHLLMNASLTGIHQESYLISELKKEKPKVHRFTMPDEASEHLQKLAALYLEGQKAPLPFFPKTLFEYKKNLEKGHNVALASAKKEFEGDGWNKYPERDDLNISFLFGPEIEFDEMMVNEEYLDLFRLMTEHIKEVE